MTLEERKELAMSLHKKRYNCCQVVAMVFADELGVDGTDFFKLCEGFGTGMGGTMQSACGALTAAAMIAGLKCSDGNLDAPATKAQTAKVTREIMNEFKDKVGAILCKDIKGVETGNMLCSCDDAILAAVEIVQEKF